MLIHGGINDENTSFNDTWVLASFNSKLDRLQGQMSISTTISQEELRKRGQPTQSSAPLMPNPRDFLRWYKCKQDGDIPEARDGHSSCKISDKIYIFGGQGENDQVFNDLYELTVEERFEDGADQQKDLPEYIAHWRKIIIDSSNTQKPCARTSQSCVAYKNRYMIIIGGETDSETPMLDSKECESSKQDEEMQSKPKLGSNSDESESKYVSIGDVWVFDTVQVRWFQITPQLKIQGNGTGRKIRKQFEPRMGHSSVIQNQFIVVFGGLNNEPTSRSMISNDLYVLSLDGSLNAIFPNDIQKNKEHNVQMPSPLVNQDTFVKSLLQLTKANEGKEISGDALN